MLLIGFLWFPALESGKKRPGFLQLICGGLSWVDNSGYAQQPATPPVASTEIVRLAEYILALRNRQLRIASYECNDRSFT
jgi:hypothetical protein